MPCSYGWYCEVSASVGDVVIRDGDVVRSINIDALIAGVSDVETIDDDVAPRPQPESLSKRSGERYLAVQSP